VDFLSDRPPIETDNATDIKLLVSITPQEYLMIKTARLALIVGAFTFAVFPLLAQSTSPKPSFEVVSIKPSPPNLGMRGGQPRGDRLSLVGMSLRFLLQQAFSQPTGGTPIGQLTIIGGPSWMDSDLYDIEAKADCSGGALSREQMRLMMQSMLEDRFQLKAHLETREQSVYNLVVAKDGPKLKVSSDQSPSPLAQGPPQPCSPATAAQALPPLPPPGQRGGPPDMSAMPRGAMMMMIGPDGMTMQAPGVPIANLVGMLGQFAGRPVIDKTDLKGLFDIKMRFSPEGITLPGARGGGPGLQAPGAGPGPAGPGGAPASNAADPVPSLFTAIQELGLRLESAKGPVEVLVVESAQKPTEN
jgi:uncharacterized protein (TIGR03435 family)